MIVISDPARIGFSGGIVSAMTPVQQAWIFKMWMICQCCEIWMVDDCSLLHRTEKWTIQIWMILNIQMWMFCANHFRMYLPKLDVFNYSIWMILTLSQPEVEKIHPHIVAQGALARRAKGELKMSCKRNA